MIKKEIIKKIEKEFPNNEIKIEGEGWDSYAFSINDKIIRIPKKIEKIKDYENEANCLKYLKNKISFEIPDVKIIKNNNINYAIHKKLIGNSWNISTYNKLSQKEKDLFSSDIATFFSEIHKIDLLDLKDKIYLDYETEISESDLINLGKSFSKYDWNKIKENLDIAKRYKLDPTFIYGDFHSSNSLIDKDHRLKCIFDFVDIRVRDRHFDFSKLYNKECKELLNNVIKQYEQITNIKIDLEKAKYVRFKSLITCLNAIQKQKHLKKYKEDILLELEELLEE